jgi:hypothetical protein
MELEKSTEQVLPGSEEGEGESVETGVGGEMIQAIYAHANR